MQNFDSHQRQDRDTSPFAKFVTRTWSSTVLLHDRSSEHEIYEDGSDKDEERGHITPCRKGRRKKEKGSSKGKGRNLKAPALTVPKWFPAVLSASHPVHGPRPPRTTMVATARRTAAWQACAEVEKVIPGMAKLGPGISRCWRQNSPVQTKCYRGQIRTLEPAECSGRQPSAARKARRAAVCLITRRLPEDFAAKSSRNFQEKGERLKVYIQVVSWENDPREKSDERTRSQAADCPPAGLELTVNDASGIDETNPRTMRIIQIILDADVTRCSESCAANPFKLVAQPVFFAEHLTTGSVKVTDDVASGTMLANRTALERSGVVFGGQGVECGSAANALTCRTERGGGAVISLLSLGLIVLEFVLLNWLAYLYMMTSPEAGRRAPRALAPPFTRDGAQAYCSYTQTIRHSTWSLPILVSSSDLPSMSSSLCSQYYSRDFWIRRSSALQAAHVSRSQYSHGTLMEAVPVGAFLPLTGSTIKMNVCSRNPITLDVMFTSSCGGWPEFLPENKVSLKVFKDFSTRPRWP
ncbi:hypothetical protein B0H16DRAFT_1689432 [Mycena metata]|uniref:Uncharacterized protein n=1 Tax=Mycena metata TaxID=1033252 RepID=A0AAD7NFF8_9AGAR|nr:hypothetical protein B0H16DRAFT_1689432 [Mycena metata]